jgi:Protein of unknown function (DUF3667)
MDELGKSFPLSEVMIDAEQSGTSKRNNEYCLNCGTKLQDTFCHHCGQKDIPKRQTLGELLTNFISSFWSYEGKFFTTVKYLVIKPGFLATEYNAGKRESYYHPARMYVFISFVFFLLLFSLPDSDSNEASEITKEDEKELKEEVKETELDSMAQDSSLRKSNSNEDSPDIITFNSEAPKRKSSGISFTGPNYKSVKAYDSAQLALPIEQRDGWFAGKLNRKASEINEKYKDNAKGFGTDFRQAFMDNFSKVLFYLLPIFALLLKLFYIRRDFFYSEHLVFSIYYYNFFYFAASLQLLVNLIPILSWAATLIGFWIFLYLLFAMKRMYQQSWKKTILKFILFSIVFMFFLGVGLGLSAFLVLLMI